MCEKCREFEREADVKGQFRISIQAQEFGADVDLILPRDIAEVSAGIDFMVKEAPRGGVNIAYRSCALATAKDLPEAMPLAMAAALRHMAEILEDTVHKPELFDAQLVSAYTGPVTLN